MGSGLIALQKPPGRQRTERGSRAVGNRQLEEKSLLPTTHCLLPPAKLVIPFASRGRSLIMRTIKSNERLVPVSCARCRASTSGLSTWWSSTALQGEIVLRLVSRLDAFSGYPFRI